MKKKVTLSKKCTLCDAPAIIGVTDFGKGGSSASLCQFHLMRFCVSVIHKYENENKTR